MTTLNDLPIGKTATVAAVGGEGSLRQHFLDMGIIPLVDVTMVKHAPMGDPLEVRIHSYELTLRRDDARKIEIVDMRDAADAQESRPLGKPVPHPGLGEGGKFHDRSEENPLPEGTPLTFALVGNQNCGKTTLFNQLTGSNQHVGNFPGVTVDRKDGCIKGHPEACVTDLPGIYSMSPYSSEEVVTRRFLLDEKPRGIINIVDATNVERNLYLTMQLMELGMPMVLALNMMDEVEGNGGTIDVNEMEKLLGIPVVPISASKNEGIGELVDHALHVARFQEPPVRQDFCAPDEAEGARLVLERLDLDQNEKDALEHIISQMEAERGLDRSAAIADMRFGFIGRVCERTVVKPGESREHARSTAIDKLLTGPFTALVIDGVFNGVGSVLSFLPTIVTLFFFLSLLEDSGYMARVAFVMDKLLRRIGLSGRSIVPMLVGFGCTVPAVMASRTLPSERDRKMTIMLTPFMSCSAKLPIYAFFTAAFFPANGAAVMVGLYFGGIAVGVLAALLMRSTMFSGEAVPFVMELPNYRMPSARNVAQMLWEKAKDFLERAFTIIFLATIVIWFLQTFDFGLNVVADSQDSMLAVVAGWIAPVFAPLGFDDWRISTALVTGVMAKESVVSTLSVLFGSTASLVAAITPLAALGLLVFCLLYTPCVAAIASVRRELGGRWALGMVFGQLAVAWAAAFAVRGVGLALEDGVAGAGTLALGAAVAVLVALAVRRIARKRREGGAVSGCGGSCDGCAGCGAMPEAPVDRAFEGTPEPEEPSKASVR